MNVRMDPEALTGGAARFAGSAEALAGNAAGVPDPNALRAAFGVIGAQAYANVAARLAEITSGTEAVRNGIMRASDVLGTTARRATTVDSDHGGAINRSGDGFDDSPTVGR